MVATTIRPFEQEQEKMVKVVHLPEGVRHLFTSDELYAWPLSNLFRKPRRRNRKRKTQANFVVSVRKKIVIGEKV